MLKQLIIAAFLVGFSAASYATDIIRVDMNSAPSSDNHAGVYTGSLGTLTLDTRNGTPTNMFDHVTGVDCWGGSGGCGKFYPQTSAAGAYRGLAPLGTTFTDNQLNIRYLKKWNTEFTTGGIEYKGDIVYVGDSYVGGFWTVQVDYGTSIFGNGLQEGLSYNRTDKYVHGNSASEGNCTGDGIPCCPYLANCNLGTGVAAAGPFRYADYVDQWVAFELEILGSTGTYRYYIWTQDGTYNGLYMEASNAETGTPGVAGISGLYYTDYGATSGSYVMVDDVVFADTYIGPPNGFGIDNTPNQFSFSDVTGAALSTLTPSPDNMTVTGIDNTTSIALSGTGCEYRVNAGSWITSGDNVALNDNVALRVTSSGSYSTDTPCTLTLNGNVSDVWHVTTLAAVSDPVAPRFRGSTISGGWR